MRNAFAGALAVVIILSPVAVAGQSFLTLHGGLNVTTLGGDDPINRDSRTGLNIGGSVYLPISEHLGATLGLAYSEKGAKGNEEGTQLTFALDYFEVPALLTVGIPYEGPVGAHVFVGPAVGIRVGCEASLDDSVLGGVFESTISNCSEAEGGFNTFDLGAIGGFGVSLETTDVTLSLDLLYNLGLTPVANTGDEHDHEEHGDSQTAHDTKNRTFTIRVGVGFSLG